MLVARTLPVVWIYRSCRVAFTLQRYHIFPPHEAAAVAEVQG